MFVSAQVGDMWGDLLGFYQLTSSDETLSFLRTKEVAIVGVLQKICKRVVFSFL